MAPLPKRKLSKGRRNRRRAHNALKATATVKCPKCGVDKLPHRACPECGRYREKQSRS